MFQLDAVAGAQTERVVVGVVKEHHACCLLVDGHGLRRRQDSLILLSVLCHLIRLTTGMSCRMMRGTEAS
jgi:hypothetical protein